MLDLGHTLEQNELERPHHKWGGFIDDAKKIMEDPTGKRGDLTGRMLQKMVQFGIGTDEEAQINEGKRIKPREQELKAYLEASQLVSLDTTPADEKKSLGKAIVLFEEVYEVSK